MQYAHGILRFLRSCSQIANVYDRYFSLNWSPFLPTDSLLCYSSPQPRQDRKTFHSTGEMSQMLPMDRCRRCQRYGEQSNYNFFSFLFRVAFANLLFFISRLKNYTGTVILLLSSYSSAFLFSTSRERISYLIYLNQVETCSCLSSRLDASWRMRILRNRRCFNEAFILKFGPCRYLTFFPPHPYRSLLIFVSFCTLYFSRYYTYCLSISFVFPTCFPLLFFSQDNFTNNVINNRKQLAVS